MGDILHVSVGLLASANNCWHPCPQTYSRCPDKTPMALLLAHEMATYLREDLNLCLHHLDSSCISSSLYSFALSRILPLFFRHCCLPEVCHAGRAAAQIARRSPLCWQSSQLASRCTGKMHLLSYLSFTE